MKNAFLGLVLSFVPLAAFAQESVQHPYQGQPAPVLGHPLDPADVAILTGHSSARTAYPVVTPIITYGNTNNPWFGKRQAFGFRGFFFPGHLRGPGFFFGGPSSPGFVFAGSTAGRR